MFTVILLCLRMLYVESRDIKVDVQEYCKMYCPIPGTVHTICEFKCSIAPDCDNFQEYELNEKERQLILHYHNEFRERVASGTDRRGGITPAVNMLELQYDTEIEIAVSCWGRRCKFDHDKCRHTPSYLSAGQNLFIESSSAPIDVRNNSYLYTCVRDWYEEIVNINPMLKQSFNIPQRGHIGHFTQVIWANSEFIGCTRVSWTPRTGLKYNLHILCNYSPAGNIFGAQVYRSGIGCEGKLIRSKRYPSLCVSPKQGEHISSNVTIPSTALVTSSSERTSAPSLTTHSKSSSTTSEATIIVPLATTSSPETTERSPYLSSATARTTRKPKPYPPTTITKATTTPTTSIRTTTTSTTTTPTTTTPTITTPTTTTPTTTTPTTTITTTTRCCSCCRTTTPPPKTTTKTPPKTPRPIPRLPHRTKIPSTKATKRIMRLPPPPPPPPNNRKPPDTTTERLLITAPSLARTRSSGDVRCDVQNINTFVQLISLLGWILLWNN
ncbi:hypothetical protein Trydic_g10847 [Trypoxylus dichotomus]